jgi:hypothetical protein
MTTYNILNRLSHTCAWSDADKSRHSRILTRAVCGLANAADPERCPGAPLERLHTDFLVVMRCTANQRQSSLFEDGYTGQQLTTSSRATSHTICGCTRQGRTLLVWGTATTQCCTCSQQQYNGIINSAKHCNAKQTQS